ncbi:MAG: hypothetical protein PHD02_03300 [Bacilli bacterium]|nr:hypothetical protein [Bacilli bacterium]
MKKFLLFLLLMIIPLSVNAEDLSITSLVVEGVNIELQDGVYEYNATVDNAVTEANFIIETNADNYQLLNNTDLIVGSNIITIELNKGKIKTEYTINVLRMAYDVTALSNNNRLTNISVSGYPLGFNSDKLEYNLNIKAEYKLSINYEVEDANALVYIEGNENLHQGSVITIKVVAQSGNVREYKINIASATERIEEEEKIEKNLDMRLMSYIISALAIILFLVFINVKGNEKEK